MVCAAVCATMSSLSVGIIVGSDQATAPSFRGSYCAQHGRGLSYCTVQSNNINMERCIAGWCTEYNSKMCHRLKSDPCFCLSWLVVVSVPYIYIQCRPAAAVWYLLPRWRDG